MPCTPMYTRLPKTFKNRAFICVIEKQSDVGKCGKICLKQNNINTANLYISVAFCRNYLPLPYVCEYNQSFYTVYEKVDLNSTLSVSLIKTLLNNLTNPKFTRVHENR
jgi:hypothetical protein